MLKSSVVRKTMKTKTNARQLMDSLFVLLLFTCTATASWEPLLVYNVTHARSTSPLEAWNRATDNISTTQTMDNLLTTVQGDAPYVSSLIRSWSTDPVEMVKIQAIHYRNNTPEILISAKLKVSSATPDWNTWMTSEHLVNHKGEHASISSQDDTLRGGAIFKYQYINMTSNQTAGMVFLWNNDTDDKQQRALLLMSNHWEIDDIAGDSVIEFDTPQQTSGSKNTDYTYTLLSDYGYVIRSTSIVFQVKACNDAYVGLKEAADLSGNLYEIVIGGWGNSKSMIRTGKQGDSQVERHEVVLDCNVYKRFNVSWSRDNVTVMRDTDSGWVQLMTWRDPSGGLDIQFVGLTTARWGSGSWKVQQSYTDLPYDSADFLVIQGYYRDNVIEFDTPIQTSGSKNTDYTYTLLSDYGYVIRSTSIVFQVKACNDAHVGLKEDADPRGTMYEIVIGGLGNSISVIRTGKQGDNQVERREVVLDCNVYKRFNVSWSGGVVTVTRDTDSGWVQLMTWSDPSGGLDIQFVGLTTARLSSGSWKVYQSDTDITSPVVSTNRISADTTGTTTSPIVNTPTTDDSTSSTTSPDVNTPTNDDSTSTTTSPDINTPTTNDSTSTTTSPDVNTSTTDDSTSTTTSQDVNTSTTDDSTSTTTSPYVNTPTTNDSTSTTTSPDVNTPTTNDSTSTTTSSDVNTSTTTSTTTHRPDCCNCTHFVWGVVTIESMMEAGDTAAVEKLLEMVKKLKSELTVNKSALTSYRIKKVSIMDTRTSANGIGYLEVVIIVGMVLAIIFLDITTFFIPK